MAYRFLPLLLCSACSLAVGDAPPAPATPIVDAGPQTDASHVETPNDCLNDQRFDEFRQDCVPLQGTSNLCQSPERIAGSHAWALAADSIVYASPNASGDGSSSQKPGSLSALVAAQNSGSSLAIILLEGDYELSETLALAVRGPLSLIGQCANKSRVHNAGSAVFSAEPDASAVQIYGIGVRGPLSDDSGVKRHAMAFDGVGTLRIAQTVISAPGGHGIALSGVGGGEGLLLQGLTFNDVGGSAIASQDALGSWTIDCNLFHGPIADHGFLNIGGESTLNLSNNIFSTIMKNAVDATDPLGSWTVDCNLFSGPISGDGINIAGGHSDSSMNLGQDNVFAIINGNAISAQGALGSWTVDCNLFRGPISGKAMHFHEQSGNIALTGNQMSSSAEGVFVTSGNAAWTVSGNQINGSQNNVPPGPMVGFGFARLSVNSSLQFNNNTIASAGGIGLGILGSLANININANSIYDTWESGVGGNHETPLRRAGLGVALVDSGNIQFTNNTRISDNAYAGVLIDLAGWSSPEPAAIAITDNQINGHGEGDDAKDVVRQNIPEPSVSTVRVERSGHERVNAVDETVAVARPSPPPPRCGDGRFDAEVEQCDPSAPNQQAECSERCELANAYLTLAAGTRHFCALRGNGRVECAGRLSDGRLAQGGAEGNGRFEMNEILGDRLPRFVQVSSGRAHSCALSSEANPRVFCWGANNENQVSNIRMSFLNRATLVGGLERDDEAQQPIPIVNLLSSADRNCVHYRDKRVACWGDHRAFGLNDNNRLMLQIRSQNGPMDLLADELWLGPENSCARVRGRLFCWGSDADGQIDNLGSMRPQPIDTQPILTAPSEQLLTGVQDVAIGWRHICAIDERGSAFCWGSGDGFRLSGDVDGNATGASASFARRINFVVESPEVLIKIATSNVESAGDDALTCAVSISDRLYCFGQNSFKLAPGSASVIERAERVDRGALHLKGLSMSAAKICGHAQDGSLHCWGDDDFRFTRAGTFAAPGPTVTRAESLAGLNPPISIASVVVSDAFAVARDSALSRYLIWGLDPSNEEAAASEEMNLFMGSGAVSDKLPSLTRRGGCFKSITDQAIHCFGNIGGQLFSFGRPIANAPNDGLLACGSEHCCASAANSTSVSCWGNCDDGRCGSVSGFLPGPTAGSTWMMPGNIDALALGDRHGCARLVSGAIHCWGDNSSYQLAQNHNNLLDTELGVMIDATPTYLTGMDTLVAGSNHNCAARLSEPKSMHCWGNNSHLQTGDNPQNPYTTTAPMVSRDWLLNGLSNESLPTGVLAANAVTTCYIANGNVFCFGSNESALIDANNPALPAQYLPRQVAGLTNIISLSLGATSACAVNNTGEVFCWGDGRAGRAGVPLGEAVISEFPTPVR
jgi:alpha-tubulin suppressor-like RCC1 family protein